MYINRVGLELETNARHRETQQPIDTTQEIAELWSSGIVENHGKVKPDAGADSVEFITHPKATLEVAVNELEHMIDKTPRHWEISYAPHRPASWVGHGVWGPDPRYTAMKEAVRLEAGDQWTGINKFTDWNATHYNISGEAIDPTTPTGVFLCNILEHAIPAIAYALRNEFPTSQGHLALWERWCDPRRHPFYGEWYSSWEEYVEMFESIPTLIRKNGDGSWYPDLSTPQSIEDPIAQGTNWKFVRRREQNGCWYIEVRSIPSGTPQQVRSVGERLLLGIGALVRWHRLDYGKDKNVPSLEAAAPALRHAHEASDLFPAEPLAKEIWHQYFYS